MSYTFKRSANVQQVCGSDPKPPDPLQRGEWGLPVNQAEWPHVKAVVRCPECGWDSLVAENHSVSAAGVLNPSYVCPNKACTFHVAPVTLQGWDGGERAK